MKSVCGGNERIARSITESGILPPPYEIARSEGSPTPPRFSSASTIRASIVGTTNAFVTPSSRTRSIHASASKLESCTIRRPE